MENSRRMVKPGDILLLHARCVVGALAGPAPMGTHFGSGKVFS